MATTDVYTIVGDVSVTKKALRFLGGDVNDGVQVDTLAAAIVGGSHTKGTFSCWFMVPDVTGPYALFGAGNSGAVEYMHICVEAGTILVMMVDTGPSTRLDVNTAARSVSPHEWHHLAVVQDGVRLKIYLDGADMPLSWTTETEPTQWFDDLDTIDGGHIGCSDSVAGGALLTNEFKGYIGDVKIWSGTAAGAALSAEEVRQAMSGASPQSAYLLAHYDFNHRVINVKNPSTYDGTLVGDLIYCDANEFFSKLTFSPVTLLTADHPRIAVEGGKGYGVFIDAA